MTVLDVAATVARKVSIDVPTLLFGATGRAEGELASLLNEAAGDILHVHDWQLLKTLATLTGDGVTGSFALPSDYDRMLRTASLWSSRYHWSMQHVLDTDQWLEMLTLPYLLESGSWTIYGGQIHILDTMASGETAQFFYISNLIVSPAVGSDATAFVADTDSFRLSEKLLGLLTVVKWKAQKGHDYSEDLAQYNIELASLIDKDNGSKPVVRGRPKTSWRNSNVWPGSVTG